MTTTKPNTPELPARRITIRDMSADIRLEHDAGDVDGLWSTLTTVRRIRAELHDAADTAAGDDDHAARKLDDRADGADEITGWLVDDLIAYLGAGGRLPSAWASNSRPEPTRTPEDDLAYAGLICTCGADGLDAACTCPTRVWCEHTNDLGDWCPWSRRVVDRSYGDDESCPAGCRKSYTEEQP